jgi:hypothetical protein
VLRCVDVADVNEILRISQLVIHYLIVRRSNDPSPRASSSPSPQPPSESTAAMLAAAVLAGAVMDAVRFGQWFASLAKCHAACAVRLGCSDTLGGQAILQ